MLETLICTTATFNRWARKQQISNEALCHCVGEMTAGLIDADLGGGILKKRLPRSGQGKRGGFRTLVATNRGGRWIFVYGFQKSSRSNITPQELIALRKLADLLLGLNDQGIVRAIDSGELIEVNCDAKKIL